MRPQELAAVAVLLGGALALGACTSTSETPDPPKASGSEDTKALGAQTSGRAVVVIQGGGSPHPYTTPWAECEGGRQVFIEGLADSGLPVFTAPGYTNTDTSIEGETGCPPQPPLEVQWNTSAYPTQAGQDLLGFLGYLNETYGYETFDLVGYSYGGIVARAAVAALKAPEPAQSAPGFSYAQAAVEAGVTIPSIVTMNTPHLGGPGYDVAENPAEFYEPVAAAWGQQFADLSMGLVPFDRDGDAGAAQMLRTSAHAEVDPDSWDDKQVGVLDDVALTLMAGDYCGLTCGDVPAGAGGADLLRTDGNVPVYSQLMLSCGDACPTPPGSVYVPPGLVPDNVVRTTLPTLHSSFTANAVGLPDELSVSIDPAAIAFLVDTVQAQWQEADVPLLPAAAQP
jgi:hypothetical protein